MKNTTFTKSFLCLLFSLAFLSLDAQLRPIKKSKLTPANNSTPKLKGCDLTMHLYKQFVYHALKKPNSKTLDYGKKMPQAGLSYENGNTYLVFGQGKKRKPVPPFTAHMASSDNGYYGGIMTEGWGTLEYINNVNYIFSFKYQEGNYDNIVEVTDIYRSSNKTYAEVKRPNGSLEQVRIIPGFIIENGCQLEVR